MSSTGMPPPADNGQANAPRVQMVTQYVKDLSFENPGAPTQLNARPNIELGVDLSARQMEGTLFEVVMKLTVNAKAPDGSDKSVFLVELAYAGLFQIQNVPQEVIQQVLLVDGPHLLFPFARRVISDVVRDGGMPPLMIEPIDFLGLYRSRAAQMQQQGTA
ncbi:MAG: protein-export chaperone SecB [Alphaproteobacteria bacterium]|nr:protein-export chaperone SecB [Alphaproteobacteria bacterium]MBL6938989.1 protein-export chaperone SecB [Alphaproteobacteria bacterium]MBL7099581.1 protein-export chaperone SecB [Alphaproteobacteria bacterium]